ncbi:Alpha/Beta hydrolase protein [Vararia minispora EC-137]|uniref:Alpha/Beta hydrolase protein n=1 Tax=Vararia minispora EC-137 TaxID=1314806 RepID=A0ACB8Q9T6_9AGAM|nr:Alpha/Beta hydrolase protein [Vararia minispora EC-137]
MLGLQAPNLLGPITHTAGFMEEIFGFGSGKRTASQPRDDEMKEVVVVFRGSVSPANMSMNFLFNLIDFEKTRIEASEDKRVHLGFRKSWSTLADKTTALVHEQLSLYPDYTIVATGHSLGGAKVRLYTYGQPRVGNASFALFVNDLIGIRNIYRGTEYWVLDSSPSETFICIAENENEEDPQGSILIPTTGINASHMVYFDIPYLTPFFW